MTKKPRDKAWACASQISRLAPSEWMSSSAGAPGGPAKETCAAKPLVSMKRLLEVVQLMGHLKGRPT
jgi:hypothetical protein